MSNKPKIVYQSKVQSFYNSISHFYSLISIVDNKAKNRGILFSRPKKGDKVLCIGFGLGEEIKKYNSFGCNTYGLEFSGGMIKSARKKNNLKNIIKGDTFNLPYRDNSFDIIYSCYMIDIFEKEDTISLLKEMRRTLKQEGKIVSVNNTFEKGIISKILIKYYLFLKDNIFRRMKTRPIIATDLFRKAGLKNIKNKKVFWASEAVVGFR
ncbi:MAG: methyltransferase domain-containing protein [Nanohaloarchaea archaeon]|nr:methyltransferase domain-containing protein [Candidatus Nanohaloarchaea archaeon]